MKAAIIKHLVRYPVSVALCSAILQINQSLGKDQQSQCQSLDGAVNITYSSSEQVILPTVPSNATLQYSKFSIVYDKRTRNPKYVIERLDKAGLLCADDEDALSKKKKRKPFFLESGIDFDVFRSNTKDYANNTYDRGHMAPAADFICTPDMRDATFTMANVCPQAPVLNKGFWAKLEAYVRYLLTHGQYQEALVITGPVYAPMFINNEWVFLNRTIGSFPKLVHVPTHFFKIVVLTRAGSGMKNNNTNNGNSKESMLVEWWPANSANKSVAIGAFLVPNADHIDAKTSLASVSVRLDQLEAIIGYKLAEGLGEKAMQKIDAVVPSSRDLSVVLNGQTEVTDLVFSNGKTTLLLPGNNQSNGKGTQPIQGVVSGGTIPTGGKNSISTVGLVSVQHLCEQVDCNKPLFGK